MVRLSEVPIDKELFKVVCSFPSFLCCLLWLTDTRTAEVECSTCCHSPSPEISEVCYIQCEKGV